jgi:hypothetical protein
MPLHLSMDGTHPVEGIYIHTQVAHAELQPQKSTKGANASYVLETFPTMNKGVLSHTLWPCHLH